jgi:hypothetical protein
MGPPDGITSKIFIEVANGAIPVTNDPQGGRSLTRPTERLQELDEASLKTRKREDLLKATETGLTHLTPQGRIL